MEIVNPHLDQVWLAGCHFVNRPNWLLRGCDSVQLALRQTERWRSAIWNPNSAVRTEQIGARQNTRMQLGLQFVEQIIVQTKGRYAGDPVDLVLPQLTQDVRPVVIRWGSSDSVNLADVRMVGNETRQDRFTAVVDYPRRFRPRG